MITNRQRFLDAIERKNAPGQPSFGTGTSIACRDLMDLTGAQFPEAHLDAEKMAALAMTGHTELGFDVVMPLFSVCHEAAAMGCDVKWGSPTLMPESGPPIFQDLDDIRIPHDLLERPGCAVPLQAIRFLKNRLGDSAAVCGKVFGSWTQSYHYFGIENFLMGTLDDPDKTHRILDRLLPVTIQFARAQIEAGADCLLLADHVTRDLCGPETYERFVMPLHQRLAEEIEVPLVLHICGNTLDRVKMIARTGVACFHWDTKSGPPEQEREVAGPKLALMGGVSNYLLLRGTAEEVAAQAANAVAAGMDVVGPECAIPLTTPLENLKAVARAVSQPKPPQPRP
jgi:MtaA/CmuA family methyltransferase